MARLGRFTAGIIIFAAVHALPVAGAVPDASDTGLQEAYRAKKKLETTIEKYRGEADLLAEIESRRRSTLSLLHGLGDAVAFTEDVWLEVADLADYKLSVEGLSLTAEGAERFTQKLKLTSPFRVATLSSQRSVRRGDRELFTFTAVARARKPAVESLRDRHSAGEVPRAGTAIPAKLPAGTDLAAAEAAVSFLKEEARLQQERRMALSASLPRERKEVVAVINMITRAARTAGLEMTSFRPGKDQPRGFYSEIPMQLLMNGIFENLLHFASIVRQYDHTVVLEHLSLEAGDGGKQNAGLNIVIQATTYLLTEDTR